MSSISAPISTSFGFLRSGKEEVDVYRFMPNHSSDHYVLFLSPYPVTPRHQCVIMQVVDGSLRKIRHCQQNVPQHYKY